MGSLTTGKLDKLAPYLDPDDVALLHVSRWFLNTRRPCRIWYAGKLFHCNIGLGLFTNSKTLHKKSGRDTHIETLLRYFNDYLMRCTFLDENGNVVAHCYQVGDGDIDHALWQSPEVDSMARPAFFLTDDKPQVDYVVSAAASLIINSLNFKETDPEYSKKSFEYGKALYDFAWKHISKYAVGGSDDFLRSDNGDRA